MIEFPTPLDDSIEHSKRQRDSYAEGTTAWDFHNDEVLQLEQIREGYIESEISRASRFTDPTDDVELDFGDRPDTPGEAAD